MVNILLQEVLRKSIHLSGILIPAGYYFIDRFTALFWLSLLLVVTLHLEWMRLHGYIQYPAILLRPLENKKMAGYAYSILAAFLVIALFSRTTAIVAFTMAVIGDTSSGIAGAVWGKSANVRQTGLPLKPAPIMLVMFLVSLGSGYLASLASGLESLPFFSIALGALGATLADCVPWQIRGRVLDDNLTIPLASAFLISVYLWI